MLPSRQRWDPEVESAVRDERGQRDREAARYDRMAGLRLLSLLEVPWTLDGLGVPPGAVVAEVGCGTGRMTLPLLRRGARVVAVDHSLESLRRLRAKLPAPDMNAVQLVQADASALPFRDGCADRALTSQVVEHLPAPEMRAAAVCELARVLRPGGRAAVSAYRYLPALAAWLPREGRHSGAIYFHRFERGEFARLLEPSFRLRRLTGALGYVWLAHVDREDPARTSPPTEHS